MAKELVVKIPCSLDDVIYRIKDGKVVSLVVVEIKYGIAKSEIRSQLSEYAVFAKENDGSISCNTSLFFNDIWFVDKAKALAKLKRRK